MNTIEKEISNTIEINKSIFTIYLKPVNKINDAKAYIEELKQKFPDATHHVSGYIIGKGGEFGHYTDDGEPSGTAGSPIFEILRKNNLTNIVFDCIRYFGGIKLGAGGLVRAYSRSMSEILKIASIVPIIDYSYFDLTISYPFLKTIDYLLGDKIIHRTFSNEISLLVKCPTIELEPLINIIIDKTINTCKIKIIDRNNEND